MPFSAEGQRILREFREIFGRNSARLKIRKDREYLVFDPLFLNDRPNEWIALPVHKIAELGMDVLLLMLRNLGEETMCATKDSAPS